MEYNQAFFSLYENLFLVLKETYGERRALELFSQIMERSLKKAYDTMGFRKGSTSDFARVLKERDESMGLRVEFPEVSESRVIYRFRTDPFPNLKGHVDHTLLDRAYMTFKLRHLLGEGWRYITTRHIWDGDDYTEHVISRE